MFYRIGAMRLNLCPLGHIFNFGTLVDISVIPHFIFIFFGEFGPGENKKFVVSRKSARD